MDDLLATSMVAPGKIQACPVGVRNVPAAVDFVYVMRRDSGYVAGQFAQRLGAGAAELDIRSAYDRAVDGIAKAVLKAFGVRHENPAVDLIDADELHQRRLDLIDMLDGVVVSMDPLMEEGALPLAFSRCYRPGGVDFIGMIPRPGYPTLDRQVQRIAAKAQGQPLIVVEDDFFTGETLTTTLESHLGDLAGSIAAVVAGTKVGLREPSFPVHPGVRYRCENDLDPLDKVDLGDPRDYIVGASGLVCRLASGNLGRLPYVLPFVSPAARASIPAEAEADFSAAALELSLRFYEDLTGIIEKPVLLEAADPAFALACLELLDLTPETAMSEVLHSIENVPHPARWPS